MAKVLFIGDIVGKGGRRVLRQVLPQWREKYKPDVVIVNVENMAHGKGVTPSTLAELDELNIDCYTSGNHIFNKDAAGCFEKYDKLIRPENYEFLLDKAKQKQSVPGHGYYRFAKTLNPHLSRFAFDGVIGNPFLVIDEILTREGQKGDIIIVDFHSEATSEKVAFGYYSDGRVTAVFGTHTHVPTADARILPGGTAYISDVGMTGPRDGVIGVKKENVLRKFLHPEEKFKNEVEEDGILQINGVLMETGPAGKAVQIEKLYQEI